MRLERAHLQLMMSDPARKIGEEIAAEKYDITLCLAPWSAGEVVLQNVEQEDALRVETNNEDVVRSEPAAGSGT